MINIISIQRGDVTISADYNALRLTPSSPFREIERTTLDIMRREYPTRENTRLMGSDGNFIEGPSLLQEKYGKCAAFSHTLPGTFAENEDPVFRQQASERAESVSNPENTHSRDRSTKRPAVLGTAAGDKGYLSRNQALELARSIYDHGDTTFGDELTKFLYVVLTHVGAQGPMLGLFDRSLISVGSRDEPLRESHGVVLHVDGKQLQKNVLESIGLIGPHYFTGFLCLKLPYLVGQYPEAVVLSDIIPHEEYHASQELRQSLESTLRQDSALFLTKTSSSRNVHVATRSPLNIGSPLQNIINSMQHIERTLTQVRAEK